MDLIQKLAEEAAVVEGGCQESAAEVKDSAGGVKEEASAPVNSGLLLIAGCHEWDNSTSKTAQGLDGPHLLDLGGMVSRCFSSSSSCFSFFLLADGGLFAIGSNGHGQLGVGDHTTRNTACQVPTDKLPAPVVKIATGKHHSLMLLENGDVYAAGSNSFGQCGLGSGTRAAQDSLSFTKISELTAIVDVACGWDHSLVCDTEGRLFTFGHPLYGQLGNGTTGEYIKEGGKGAALQFSCVCTPYQVKSFLLKDSHGRLKEELPSTTLKIVKVAAGKNHSMCLADESCGSKVFTWGFGGYGRLGHRSAEDEFRPRELEFFSPTGQQKNQVARQVVQMICGSSFSLFITKTRQIYFCGMMSNSPRGEAQTYPKITDELYDWSVGGAAAGSNLIVVSAEDACVAWGVPVAGKLGLEGMATTTRVPKYVDSVRGFVSCDVSCGYGHTSFVLAAAPGSSEETTLRAKYPVYPSIADAAPPAAAAGGSKKRKEPAAKGAAKGAAKKGRK